MRIISLLNVDTKLISKVLAERLKAVLPPLIYSNQMAYLNGLLVEEKSNIWLTSSKQFFKIEKVLNCVDHNFLFKVLSNLELVNA